jgi:hypothetical protein
VHTELTLHNAEYPVAAHDILAENGLRNKAMNTDIKPPDIPYNDSGSYFNVLKNTVSLYRMM